MTALYRIGLGVLTAVVVAFVLSFFGMSPGKPAAIGTIAGVIIQLNLRAAAARKANAR